MRLQPTEISDAAEGKQGADDPVFGPRRDPGHGAWSGAAQQLHQHPVGDVVPVVRRGDRREFPARLVIEQCPVATPTPGGFAPARSLIVPRQLHDRDGDIEGIAEAATEIGVGVGFRTAQTVVDVDRGELEIEFRVFRRRWSSATESRPPDRAIAERLFRRDRESTARNA